MTLRQYGLLVDRLNEHVRREDRRAGLGLALFYNANRDPDKDPQGKDWPDFFPEWKEPQSDDEMFEAMQMWVGPVPEGLSH